VLTFQRQFLDTEFEAAQRAGVRGVTMLEHLTIGKKDVGPAIKFPQQGQFHPTKYLSGLAKAIQANGGQIYTQSKVTKIDDSSDKHHTLVDVDGGRATISAQRVVVATNAPIIDNATIYAQQAAYRSYVVALSVPKDTLPQALFWDTIDPYHYVRKTVDPNDDRREIVIVGGEDHKVGQKDDMPMRLDELERWAREKLGIEGRRVYAWSGQIQVFECFSV
jgi:glycine/D-amino acid oxidase-like deaminating enzyme